jgi:outer membrane protein OmpA-like peptidoglycan-associated protein
MRKEALQGLVVLSFFVVLSGLTGCARNTHFGIRNKALGVPKEFAQTEAAIEKAERSPGAQYAPEKIAKAQELGKKAIEVYWGCRTEEAMALLAEARRLALQAKIAKAPPKPVPAPVAAVPAPAPAVTPPAKKAPAPSTPVAVPPKPKMIIILKGANFGFDSANLTPEARALLNEQAVILERKPTIKVKIAGHADTSGPEAYNQGLSERRAKAVKAYFISKGIAPDRLIPIGYGESRPIATNDTREGRANNRRVELKALE